VQPILRSKEKEKLIERLNQLLDGADLGCKSPPWPGRLPPGEVRTHMRSLLESVRILQKPFEKMDWIQRGVFPVLLKVMQRNHIETLFNEVPIKVCSLSLSLSLSLSVSVSLSLLRKLVAQTHQSLLLLSGTHTIDCSAFV
jgi:hypothetical protein